MKLSWALLFIGSIGSVLAGLFAKEFVISIDWILLGSVFGIDDLNRPFLIVSGIVWSIACLYKYSSWCNPNISNFQGIGYFLVFLGNLLAVISLDVITFYSTFALMSLSAYFLITVKHQKEKRIAGRIYIVFTIIGELMLFAAMVGLVHFTNEIEFRQMEMIEIPEWVIALIIFGFGIKVGLFPLHFTLPIIYKAAPIANAIILGGSAINIGLLGWIRWIPFSDAAYSIGLLIIALGLIGYLYAILMGILQSHPRALLGYSSISQMCLIAVIFGATLYLPSLWKIFLSSVLLAIMHHAFAKTFLFASSQGIPSHFFTKFLWWAGVTLAGFGLAGAPATAGYYAKNLLQQSSEHISLLNNLSGILWISSALTTCLLLRFLWLTNKKPRIKLNNEKLFGLLIAFGSLVIITIYSITADTVLSEIKFYYFLPILIPIVILGLLIQLRVLRKPVVFSYQTTDMDFSNVALDYLFSTSKIKRFFHPINQLAINLNTRFTAFQENKFMSRLDNNIEYAAPVWSRSSILVLIIILLIGFSITFIF